MAFTHAHAAGSSYGRGTLLLRFIEGLSVGHAFKAHHVDAVGEIYT
ncbi:MAG: hypothetical protein II628_09655 [Lachnospiraceae bacterium]|nr:hypothetical protein [Lachnospiraceae bacterium]